MAEVRTTQQIGGAGSLGKIVTGLAFVSIEPLYVSTARGSLTLPQLLQVPYGVVVCAVVVIALAGFRGAEWLESRR